ncbi:MAG TPA: HNH endonuclease, partial [Anaeromyxobacteraceae bacterium]|nr:HNH endonuclease [Anaeromyxobacteraceae bacterium]
SMRATLDREMKADLETLASLLSHTKGSDLAAVLHEAIRCGIEKHGKRKGAVEPERTRAVPTGEPTTDNVRILCKRHNLLHAEQTFGREHMARFTGAQLILG